MKVDGDAEVDEFGRDTSEQKEVQKARRRAARIKMQEARGFFFFVFFLKKNPGVTI